MRGQRNVYDIKSLLNLFFQQNPNFFKTKMHFFKEMICNALASSLKIRNKVQNLTTQNVKVDIHLYHQMSSVLLMLSRLLAVFYYQENSGRSNFKYSKENVFL